MRCTSVAFSEALSLATGQGGTCGLSWACCVSRETEHYVIKRLHELAV